MIWHLGNTEQESRGRVILLVGEAGIGKTRTAEECAALATGQGWIVCAGWCDESGVAAPYRPWIRILQALLAQRAPNLVQVSDDEKSVLSRIMPGLYSDGAGDLPSLDPDELKLRFFDVTSSLLSRIMQVRPVMLFVDDLHMADQSSLELLDYVAKANRDGPLIILGAYRDVAVGRRHPFSETLARLSRLAGYDRVALSGLDAEQLDELCASFPDLPPGVGGTVGTRTDGNPLYATLLIRALAREPETVIPPSVKDIVVGLLATLSEACVQAIRACSVAGRQIHAPLMCRLLGLTPGVFYDLLDEAQGCGLVVFGPDDLPRFSHMLVQEAVYDAVSRAQKIELHESIASEMAATAATSLDSDALLEITYHYECARMPIEMARWAQKAFVSLKGRDLRGAYQCCRRALAALNVSSGIDPRKIAEWRVRLTIAALHVVGPTDVAREEVEGLMREARRNVSNLDPGDASMPTLWCCYSDFLALRGDRNQALRCAREAGGFVTVPTDEATRLHWIMTLLARLKDVGEVTEAERIAKQEIERAPSDPLISLLGQNEWFPFPRIVAFYAYLRALRGDPGDGLCHLETAIEMLRKDGQRVPPEQLNLPAELDALEGIVDIASALLRTGSICYYYLGDVDRLERTAAQFQSVCTEHDLHYLTNAREMVALCHRLRSHWEGILETHEEMTADPGGVAPVVSALRFEALAHLGREIDRAEFATALGTNASIEEPEYLLALARTLVRCPDLAHDDAVSSLVERLERWVARTHAKATEPFILALCAQIARARGDNTECARCVQEATSRWNAMGASGHVTRLQAAFGPDGGLGPQ